MALALFDLDQTLVDGNSPALWFQYLHDSGHPGSEAHCQTMAQFAQAYHAGELDYREYARFELSTLTGIPLQTLYERREIFRREYIRPNISDQARALVESHRQAGDTLVIITATNRFVAEASALEFDVKHLLATDPEILAQGFTGNYIGDACFQEGKIAKLNAWLEEHPVSLEGSRFYSDSRNDLPLLEHVEQPVAVNPDSHLATLAKARGWPIMDLRVQASAITA